MTLLDQITDASVWNRFYEYKKSLACRKQFTDELRCFIDEKRYMNVYDNIKACRPFPLPRRSVISKMGTDKKRVVYTYPPDENTVLKLLTWLMLRKYDSFFSRNLYSFRPNRTAKDAVRYLLKTEDIMQMYYYKVDIHDYFNSIPVEKLLPMLKSFLAYDKELFRFLSGLLLEPCVISQGMKVTDRKGIMAGTPISSVYANLYLSELDRFFYDNSICYARYSDDIIVFAQNEDMIFKHAEFIKTFLSAHSLEVNPAKESFGRPGEGFVFLGFSCKEGIVDIAPVSVTKMKHKMRRKRDALARWQKRGGIASEKAARAFIRIFNRKLLESPKDNELSWSSWFFPVINTTKSLHEIDIYAQDCCRYLMTGRHTKSRFNVRYEELKKLGYRSLVHEYYSKH